MGKNYWNNIKNGNINFPILPGQWVAVEIVFKPSWGGKYQRTPFDDKLGFKTKDRISTSWNDINKAMDKKKKDILKEMGLTGKANVRLPEIHEYNLLANREGWGTTDESEWTNTEFRGFGSPDRILSGNLDFGGAANISMGDPKIKDLYGAGWRAMIVLEP